MEENEGVWCIFLTSRCWTKIELIYWRGKTEIVQQKSREVTFHYSLINPHINTNLHSMIRQSFSITSLIQGICTTSIGILHTFSSDLTW